MPDITSTFLDTAPDKTKIAFAQVMKMVADDYGKPLSTQLKEMVSLCMRGNRLTTEEYYSMRLYEDDNLSAQDKAEYVGLDKSRSIWGALNRINPWAGVIEDKLAFEFLMRGFGLPVTTTLAIMGGKSTAPNPQRLQDLQAFKTFMAAATYPLFCKPLEAVGSVGTLKVIAFDAAAQTLTKHDGAVVPVENFWNDVARLYPTGYLIQDCLTAHDELQAICGGGMPTVRIVTLDQGNGPELYTAAIKLTGGNNVADNFWRGGNLIAPVDVETGKMGKAITMMGPEGEFCATHPDTGAAIDGTALPNWNEAKEVSLNSARLLKDAVLIGFDVALSDQGPVIIEGNSTPDLNMLQLAHRHGMLDDTMKQALDHVDQWIRAQATETKNILREERRANAASLREALSRKVA